jgi:hypothetical protein
MNSVISLMLLNSLIKQHSSLNLLPFPATAAPSMQRADLDSVSQVATNHRPSWTDETESSSLFCAGVRVQVTATGHAATGSKSDDQTEERRRVSDVIYYRSAQAGSGPHQALD